MVLHDYLVHRFSSPPYTNGAKEVIKLVEKLDNYSPTIKLHVVPFTDLQLKIYEHCDESYAMTCMRRMMYRIAQKVALNNNCLVLANGESIGQVSLLQSLEVLKCY